ncbi:MAG: preprotein translocase subunit YajC [Marmoricola sp.]
MKGWESLLPFVLIVLVFWFLVIRPQRKRSQDMAATQGSVAPGSQVMLGSGIFGTVASVDDDSVQLEVAPGATIKVARQAVVRIVEEPHTADQQVEERSEPSTDVIEEQ